MRALHLCFWLHHPYELHSSEKWDRGYFGGEAAFRKADQEQYQPLLALLERNAQRYAKLRVSLVVSGVWLEQTERWDAELIRRVKKLVDKGNVELVVAPYYHAMAAFYSLDELKRQILRMREKLEQVFGVQSEALVLPELVYQNRLAKWADRLGFKVMLAGDAADALGWRTVNRLYEAKGCDKLRVAFDNAGLMSLIVQADDRIMGEVRKEAESVEAQPEIELDEITKAANAAKGLVQAERLNGQPSAGQKIFEPKLFRKELDLAFLRGDLVNLYLDPEILAKWRDRGIIGFFDELFKMWVSMPGAQLVGVKELAELPVQAEVSVRRTVSKGGASEQNYQLPLDWTPTEDVNSQRLYVLREDVVKTGDRDLYVDFARLTTREHARGGEAFEQILKDIEKRLSALLNDVDAKEAPKENGMTASTSVRVNFDYKARETRQRREELIRLYREANEADEYDSELDDAEAAIQVLAQRMRQVRETEQDYGDLAEAEVIDDIWMDDVAEEPTTEEASEEAVEPESDNAAQTEAKTKKRHKKIVID